MLVKHVLFNYLCGGLKTICGMITLHFNNTTLDVIPDDGSFRYRAIMGDDSVTLKFALNRAIDFPIGTWMTFQGDTYTLTSPERWTRKGNEHVEYTLVLDGRQAVLKKFKLRNQQDGRLKFSMNATPAEFLNLIVANLNQSGRDSGWSGTCAIEAEGKTIEFNHQYVYDALRTIAETFETEFSISGRGFITLGKVEIGKDNPLPLSYGRGNGFMPDTGRINTDGSLPVDVLYVQGGERNIDRSKYGSAELHLPKGQTLEYGHETYVASADGLSIQRMNVNRYGNEDSVDLSEIYPKRVGTISSVIVVDEEKNFVDFTDTSIPADLDYNQQLITGEKMSVIFQTGMLAGREFDINKYTHTETDGDSVIVSRRFEIVPQEIDGIVMPSGNFMPVTGDKYAIYGCTLPDTYIADNTSRTGAEWDLFTEAARYLHEHSEFKFTFTGELQGKWARENWSSVGGRLVIGGYILFSDTDFVPDGTPIRITGIKEILNNPYSPIIELSTGVNAGRVSGKLNAPAQNEVKIEEGYKRSVSFTKRRYADALETMSALMDAKLDGFTDGISPIVVHTMQLIAGDESLQFRYVTSMTNPSVTDDGISYNASTKKLTAPESIIQHMTLGIKTLSSSHAVSEYKFWNISAFESPFLGDALATQTYYLYAKASKTTTTASYVLSETAIAMEGVSGYYHLLVGILGAEIDGERSFVTLYGFTEILPSRVTTDKVVSANGTSWWDLLNNAFNFGDKLKYNVNGDGQLVLNGTFVQSGNGSTAPISAWCGLYSASRIYKLGDEVYSVAADGSVSTYRYINSVAGSSHALTDANYWQISAKGARGENGTSAYSPYIGDNGNWYLYDDTQKKYVDSGRSAQGDEGHSPYIGPNGNWYEWDESKGDYTDTGIKAEGSDGDSVSVQYSANGTSWHGSFQSTDIYMRQRVGSGSWSSAIKIVGEDGADGDYTSFVFKSADEQPETPTSTNPVPTEQGWSDSPTEISGGGSDGGGGTTPDPEPPSEGVNVGGLTNVRFEGNWAVSGNAMTSDDIDDNGSTTQKVTFHANAGDKVSVTMTASCEKTHDKGSLYDLDSEASGTAVMSVSDTDSSVHVFTIPTTGDHYFYVNFSKDGSISRNDDNVTVQFQKGDLSGGGSGSGGGSEILAGTDVRITFTDDTVTIYQNASSAIADWATLGLTESQRSLVKMIEFGDEITSFGGYIFYYYSNLKIIKFYATSLKFVSKALTGIPTNGDYYIRSGVSINYAIGETDTFLANEWTEHTISEARSAAAPAAAMARAAAPAVFSTTALGKYVWMSSSKIVNGRATGWSTPLRITPIDGEDGADGPAGPSIVFRGRYNVNPNTGATETQTYYGNRTRVDVVYYPTTNQYYKAKTDAPSGTTGFSGMIPTNTIYWEPFGASYESIATGLMLAEQAVIENAIIRILRTSDNLSAARIVAENNVLSMFDNEGKLKLIISGDDMGSAPASQNLIFAGQQFISEQSGEHSYVNDVIYKFMTLSIIDPANVVNLPSLAVEATFNIDSSYVNGDADVTLAAGWMIDGIRHTPSSQSTILNNNNSSGILDVTIQSEAVTLSVGSHDISVYVGVYIKNNLSDEYGGGGVGIDISANSLYNTGTLDYFVQKVEVAKNGFRAMFASNYLAEFKKSGTSNSGVSFLLRAGNYGIRITDSGLQKTSNGGSTWTNI